MAENNKHFYQFRVSRNDSYEERIKSREGRYSFGKVLEFLEKPIDGEELRKKLGAEIEAVQKAFKAEEGKRAAAYNAAVKEADGAPNVDVIAKYFEAGDKCYEFEDKYYEYLQEYEKTHDDGLATNENYKEAVEAFKAHEKAEEDFKKLFSYTQETGDFAVLNKMPDTVLDNMVKIYNEKSKEGKEKPGEEFDRIYNDIMSNTSNAPSYKEETKGSGKDRRGIRAKDEDGKDIIINSHRMSVHASGVLAHAIKNLDDTGLAIVWVGDELGVTYCTQELTEAQVKALAEYCYEAGVDVKDYNQLNDLKVVDGDKNEIGTAGEVLAKALDRLNGKSAEDNTDEQQVKKDKKNREVQDIDFSQFLSKPKLKDVAVGKTLRKKAKECLANMSPGYKDEQLSISNFAGSCVISVYNNEDDKLDDGKLGKDGKHKHTKQFSITFDYASVPPSAELYFPTGTKLKADHFRTVLNGFKELGYRYVKIPPVGDTTKEGRGILLEAMVKTGLIPLCVPSKGGTVLGEKDLSAMVKKKKKEKDGERHKFEGNVAAEYLMRLHAEVMRQVKHDQKTKGKADTALVDSANAIAQRARFENFALSGMSRLKSCDNKKVQEKEFEALDCVCAVYAMTEIINELQVGTINGKPFNPLAADNNREFKKALIKHMAAVKPNVVEEFYEKLSVSEKNLNGKVKSVLKEIMADDYSKSFEAAVSNVSDYTQMDREKVKGIDLGKVPFNPSELSLDSEKYDIEHIMEYRNGTRPYPKDIATVKISDDDDELKNIAESTPRKPRENKKNEYKKVENNNSTHSSGANNTINPNIAHIGANTR
ncbi:MAG: hypothetical protein MJ210_01555 [Alphaproteobacteria bacterium]|nr:hypothetical protein [Alphaproteobacteria bacterium]